MTAYKAEIPAVVICVSCLLLDVSAHYALAEDELHDTYIPDKHWFQPPQFNLRDYIRSDPGETADRATNKDSDYADPNIGNQRSYYPDDEIRAGKRALSVLTRWRSFGGQWGQPQKHPSARKMPRAPMALMQNGLGGTKDMPLRRVGGPLRWGR